jgi:hypothetical protein
MESYSDEMANKDLDRVGETKGKTAGGRENATSTMQ